jgi:large subunit ribosomal protein L10
MENPRPEKVAVVEEVRQRFSDSTAALLTEYRGLDVTALAALRGALRQVGSDYKVYKNTLVRLAVREVGLDVEDLLVGPTAIAFVKDRPGGEPADPVLVAKALRDFARTNPALVVKGGVMAGAPLTADDAKALADVEPREVLLSRLAGGLAAPMTGFASLLQALPRNFAYGLKALIDEGGAAPSDAPVADAPAEPSEPSDGPAPEAEASSDSEES